MLAGRKKVTAREGRLQQIVDGVRRDIEQVARSREPVLVGPFTGEVGYELLYWIPFIRWAVREHPELADRLIVVSRGGTHHWLSGLGADYIDLLELYAPDEFVRRRPSLKQRKATEFEQETYARVHRRLGIERAVVLHPEILFNAYYALLKVDPRAFSRAVVARDWGAEGLLAVYEPLPAPEAGSAAAALPDEYVGVRFYFRPSFPDIPDNRAFAHSVITLLSRRTAVVLLNNRLELDDHYDLDVEQEVVTIDRLMRPEDNLHVQTIALSLATAFVGTYGGLAYLAPFLRVPALSFGSNTTKTHPWHLDLAHQIFDAPGFGSLVSLRPSDLQLVELVLGARTTEPES